MLISLIRTIILYALIILTLRITGKRQLGELQPSELVLSILISDLAAIPMQDTGIPLLSGIIPIITLISCEVIISFVSLKNNSLRRFITGQPSIIIRNGVLNQREMERLRINIDDLMEELRQKNVMSIEEVNYAILETTGKLSVFPKTQDRGVKVSDLNLNITDPSFPHPIITDGEVDLGNLKDMGFDQRWLEKQLHNNKVKCIKDVLYMSVDSDNNVFLLKKEIGEGKE